MTQITSNPFQLLEERLTTIENLLVDIKKQNNEPGFPQETPEQIGGIQLAQQITGLAKPTIYALVWQAKIPCMKQGKKLYFSREELTDWIKSGRRETVEEKATNLSLELSRNKKRTNRQKSKI